MARRGHGRGAGERHDARLHRRVRERKHEQRIGDGRCLGPSVRQQLSALQQDEVAVAPQRDRWHPQTLPPARPPIRRRHGGERQESPSTRRALARRNFGQTSSLNPTAGISVMMRSSERPIGKYPA